MKWKSIMLIELPIKSDDSGQLVVFDAETIENFNISRIFHVFSDSENVRGKHAHKECNQVLFCNSGKILVKTFDGKVNEEHLLDRPNLGLFVSAGVWSEQLYLTDGAMLTVVCDRPYEPEDYIRDFSEFLSFVNNSSSVKDCLDNQ
jgi:dTDP-4-dehydrorhamnose 3,5-epimerase-like enzyme